MLTTIPLEILVNIFAHLPATSLLNCTLVCRFIHETIVSSVTLQYALLKEKAGVEDSSSNIVPITTRLALLHKREAAWKNFDYAFRRTVQVGNPTTHRMHNVSRSAFFLGIGQETLGGGLQGVQYATLPRRMDEEVFWKKITVAGKLVVSRIGVCDESDLIVLPCYSSSDPPGIDIYFQRISDAAPHPEAIINPIIVHVPNVDITAAPPCICIGICGSTLVLVFTYLRNFQSLTLMYVYNWCTGTKATSRPVEVQNVMSAGVVFLREDTFILPSAERSTLEVYTLPAPIDNPDTLRPIVTLDFPDLNKRMIIAALDGGSDSNPRGSYPISKSNGDSELPFINRSKDALLLFALNTAGEGHIFETFSMVVHRDSLLELVLPYLTNALTSHNFFTNFDEVESGGEQVNEFVELGLYHGSENQHFCIDRVKWGAWAHLTRWFRCDSVKYSAITSGCRYVRMNEGHVEVLDFGRGRVRDCMSRGGKREENSGGDEMMKQSWTLVSDSTVIENESFAEDIVSSLPYIITRSEEKFEWKGAIVDAERIIGIKHDSEVKEVDVLYFG